MHPSHSACVIDVHYHVCSVTMIVALHLYTHIHVKSLYINTLIVWQFLMSVSYMFSRYQVDDTVISKCGTSDELFVNAAVQDLMIAQGIKLLPVSHQIEVLTSCVISKTIYSFYGGLSCPDLCVTTFDALMSI